VTRATDAPRQPDPDKPTHIAVVGKKGEGKTELAWLIFDSFPGDRILVDPNGDIKVAGDDGNVVVLAPGEPVPNRWPASAFEDSDRPGLLVYHPQFDEPDYLDEIDRCVRLAMIHGDTAIFVDEAHEAIPAGRVPPAARRALRQGRHDDLTQIWATPRPITSDPLMIGQADWVYIFKLPNPADRKRVAENIYREPKEFDEAVAALGPHEYLRYDAGIDDLAHYPALPPELLAHHKG
jgi:hypothetical protein